MKVINSRKRSKTLIELKLVENISKNLQSFLEISSFQKEVLLSHKLQDHAYENFLESIKPSRFVSQRARMLEEFDSRKVLH